ncbi:MAG TPA: hypothetical protein VHA82_06470 [Ramlibacter sp.]|uniref:hypothetical protein n=1 Tax=Ramlibacter sp. TaxID=1917967 RepID=UPI002BE32FCA|nr:hypothetical protein [Ramlibacter sp.]HVZ43439.1 hypothetical protein [Ramlibacter sp.]
MGASAVLYLTHRFSRSLAARFERLRREAAGHADCFVLLHDDGGEVTRAWRDFLGLRGALDALHLFTPESVRRELGVTLFDTGFLGSVHLPLLRFAHERPYAHYWQVEGDVEYRGDWGGLFAAFSQVEAPALAAHLHRFADWPTWHWWPTLRPPEGMQIARRELRKAFFPVSRFSAAALRAIEAAHVAGWLGHMEVLIPTVLLREGMRVGDLREHLPCYIGDGQNPSELLLLQSTLRWRPEISVQEFTRRGKGALIFHPVKQDWCFDGERVVTWEGAPPLPQGHRGAAPEA